MRKTLLTLALLVCAFVAANASKNFQLFVPNEDGEIVITRTYPTSKTEKEASRAIVKALNGGDGDIEKVEGNLYHGKIQTQNYYNPFSGSTRRYITLDMTIIVENGAATLTIRKMSVTEVYQGYVTKNNTTRLDTRMEEYFDAKKMVEENAGTRKELKEAKELMNDMESDFYPSEEELAKRLNKIKL